MAWKPSIILLWLSLGYPFGNVVVVESTQKTTTTTTTSSADTDELFYKSVLLETNTNYVSQNNESVNHTSPQTAPRDDKSQCRLYMAPSSLSAQAGLGIFTAVDLKQGEEIPSSKDLTLHIVDPDLHRLESVGLKLLMEEYAWEGYETGGHFEGVERVISFVPGMGSLANGLPFGHNVERGAADRFAEHSSGRPASSTTYHDSSFVAKVDIAAGSELIISYGQNWFTERSKKQNKTKLVFEANKIVTSPNITYGMCLDNLQVGDSTIPGAGKGAFASRFIANGSVIAPMPLLTIFNRDALHMARSRQMPDGNLVHEERKQILLNYCFGHENSPVLLLPYSPVVNYVNHHSTKVNAKILWSTGSFHQSQWLQLSIEDMARQQITGLMFDLIATRDILPGEEVLLNYGPSWQRAWDEYIDLMKDHQPIPKISAGLLNRQLDKKTLMTLPEQSRNPYPPNVHTACNYDFAAMKDLGLISTDSEDKNSWATFNITVPPVYLRPCRIFERHGSNYLVEILNRPSTPAEQRIPPNTRHFLQGVERSAIQFVDKPYSTDQQQLGAFRHYIPIPAEMVPPQWQRGSQPLNYPYIFQAFL